MVNPTAKFYLTLYRIRFVPWTLACRLGWLVSQGGFGAESGRVAEINWCVIIYCSLRLGCWKGLLKPKGHVLV